MERHIRLLAHNVRSLWNVGAFFRTCDALKVEHLYLTGYTGTPPRKEISKTAIGADETVPFSSAKDPLEVLQELKSQGWQIVALELTKDAVHIEKFTPENKVCLVVGHELEGVSPEILAICDATVMIPMLGTKESLNVAVATGIALHRLRFA
jgi:tRNA G18 (ribose-2'-O)-methylase SpoU